MKSYRLTPRFNRCDSRPPHISQLTKPLLAQLLSATLLPHICAESYVQLFHNQIIANLSYFVNITDIFELSTEKPISKTCSIASWQSLWYSAKELQGRKCNKGRNLEGPGPCSTKVSIWWHVDQHQLNLNGSRGGQPWILL